MLGEVALKFLPHDNKKELVILGTTGGQLEKTSLNIEDCGNCIQASTAALLGGATIINPIGVVDSLRSVGCVESWLPFLGRVTTSSELCLNLRLLSMAIRGNESNLDTLSRINGYKILAFLLHRSFNIEHNILNEEVMTEVMTMVDVGWFRSWRGGYSKWVTQQSQLYEAHSDQSRRVVQFEVVSPCNSSAVNCQAGGSRQSQCPLQCHDLKYT
jgi:hypothetical protein